MSVLDLICYARTHSPFYKDLYDGVEGSSLADLPVVDQAAFWAANTVRNNQVLTRAHRRADLQDRRHDQGSSGVLLHQRGMGRDVPHVRGNAARGRTAAR